MYRTAAPRVPDWEPPFWLRVRNYARNFDWSSLKPDPNSRVVAALVVGLLMPAILAFMALKLAWWLVVNVTLGILFVLMAGIASHFTGEAVRLEVTWK